MKDFLPAIYPAFMVGFADMLADPVKLAGFIVLLLQAVYVVYSIQAKRKVLNEKASD